MSCTNPFPKGSAKAEAFNMVLNMTEAQSDAFLCMTNNERFNAKLNSCKHKSEIVALLRALAQSYGTDSADMLRSAEDAKQVEPMEKMLYDYAEG